MKEFSRRNSSGVTSPAAKSVHLAWLAVVRTRLDRIDWYRHSHRNARSSISQGKLPPALARADGRLRSLHSADPPHAPRRDWVHGRSVPLSHLLQARKPIQLSATASKQVQSWEKPVMTTLLALNRTGVRPARDCMAHSRRQGCAAPPSLGLHHDYAPFARGGLLRRHAGNLHGQFRREDASTSFWADALLHLLSGCPDVFCLRT